MPNVRLFLLPLGCCYDDKTTTNTRRREEEEGRKRLRNQTGNVAKRRYNLRDTTARLL